MGRGEESLLGPVGAMRRQEKKEGPLGEEKEEMGEESILFSQPPLKVSSLYDCSPEAAAKKIDDILDDISCGNFYSLLKAVDRDKPSIRDNPHFLDLFQRLAKRQIISLASEGALPKRAKGLAKEREEMAKRAARYLAGDAEGIINSQSPLPEKERLLQNILQLNYEDFLLLALAGKGPSQETLLRRLSVNPLGPKSERAELSFLLQGEKTKEKEEIFQEIVRRQAFHLMHRAKPRGSWLAMPRYSTFSSTSIDGSILHLLNDKGRSLCSDNGEVVYHSKYISHGAWRDGQISGQSRQCLACRRAADPELLQEVEEERGDNQAVYFGPKTQGMVEDLAKDPAVFVKAQELFKRAATPEVFAKSLRREIAPRLGEIMADSAEDEESLLLFAAGGHIAWSDIDPSRLHQLESKGIEKPPLSLNWEYRLKPTQRSPEEEGIKREDDPLLRVIPLADRRAYVKLLLQAALEEDHKKRFAQEQKGKDIIHQAIDNFLSR